MVIMQAGSWEEPENPTLPPPHPTHPQVMGWGLGWGGGWGMGGMPSLVGPGVSTAVVAG